MGRCFYLIVLSAWISIGAERAAPGEKLSRSAADHSVATPLAPPAYRRPSNFTPRLYPKPLHELAKTSSEAMEKRAQRECARVRAVNAEGKWKPTPAGIDAHHCPEWFQDAKLGIFIDWGLWSIPSWCPYRPFDRMYPDWYELRMYSNYTEKSPFFGYRNYHLRNWGADFERDHFIDLFQARTFDPQKLCALFQECGAKYVVPFLKHHSGFCLWDSSWTFRDVVDQGPKRDLCASLVRACRERDLKFGFYFSTGEWEYPLLNGQGQLEILHEMRERRPYSKEMETRASGKIAVRDYVNGYSIPQAIEFIDRYDPDLLWYDYDWCDYADQLGTYEISAYFYNRNEGRKEVAVNDRYGNGRPAEIAGKFSKARPRKWLRTVRGDFYTDESGDTTECIDPAKYHPWEACRGISTAYGNHWGEHEGNVLSEKAFLCEFTDIVARGGNLLLLINLDGQGSIPPVQESRLRQIGAWLKQYGEAIYATRVCAPFKTETINYTQSKDGKTVYAIVKKPAETLLLEAELPADTKVRIVGTEEVLAIQPAAKGIRVRLPSPWAQSELPIALRCSR